MTHHASIAGRAAKAFERAESLSRNSVPGAAFHYFEEAYKLSRLAYELATDQVAEEE